MKGKVGCKTFLCCLTNTQLNLELRPTYVLLTEAYGCHPRWLITSTHAIFTSRLLKQHMDSMISNASRKIRTPPLGVCSNRQDAVKRCARVRKPPKWQYTALEPSALLPPQCCFHWGMIVPCECRRGACGWRPGCCVQHEQRASGLHHRARAAGGRYCPENARLRGGALWAL